MATGTAALTCDAGGLPGGCSFTFAKQRSGVRIRATHSPALPRGALASPKRRNKAGRRKKGERGGKLALPKYGHNNAKDLRLVP